ncbi:tetratricopeptide (TPR) repeat protein [Streptacidiphilus sp. MAP12-20]|uniref:hypothetical protein n=1 Tax=Streptacidiphilus sp. MAP12-20 TaxID=3156299 RepID=UPI00351656A4
MPSDHQRPTHLNHICHLAHQAGWTTAQTVAAFVDCCGVSLLRAHRLARGWTLDEAVERLRALARSLPSPPSFDAKALRDWETHPSRKPRLRTVELLCCLYDSSPTQLGLTGQADGFTAPADTAREVSTVSLVTLPEVRVGILTGDDFDQFLNTARRTVDQTLASATVSEAQLDDLEQRLRFDRQAYMSTAPMPMLKLLFADLAEVERLHSQRQPPRSQLRLSEMTAIVSTLIADALMKLGRLRDARGWYATAQTAADETDNKTLRARVRVQAAMLPYYYGPLSHAVSLAREARYLSRQSPSPTAAFASAAEARALARREDKAGARQAIHLACRLLDYCDPDDRQDDAWAFPVRRMYLYLSGAHTALGEVREARKAQDEALKLYPDHDGIDPALLHLEAALCLVAERSAGEACQLAARTLLQVPENQRTRILSHRAQQVIEALPPSQRRTREVRELGDVLMLPTASV